MNMHASVPAAEKAFRIDWAIELNASSPNEAACFAREIQEQSENSATIFAVTDKQTGEITVHDIIGDNPKGTNFPARRPEDTESRRSLRPGGQYRTRDGEPAEVVEFDREGEFPLTVRFQRGGVWHSGRRTKAGLHPQGGGQPHPLDIVEVNPTLTRWLRVYDRKLNAAGKQEVGGKEFAAERGLFLYMFDTEAEARANLRGVRAVFPIEYREGEGLG